MSVNRISSKEGQEVNFFLEIKKLNHSGLIFNENELVQITSQKHIDMC